MLTGKKIILGVSGGIAVYKSVDLVRRLKEHGAEVRVVMTTNAREFVSPMTFQAVSGEPVSEQLFDEAAEAAMGHIEFARWADLIVIAPTSANTLAKLAAGLADDLLSTLCLASPSPLALCPAMNQQMWRHEQVQANVKRLQERNIAIWGPDSGPQACGDIGAGRMVEPMTIVDAIKSHFNRDLPEGSDTQFLMGKKVVITAGPTHEPIDPVRFIANRSSGKMGYALAEQAQKAGAEVILVSGPVNLNPPSGVTLVPVGSAFSMLEAVNEAMLNASAFIACAAVADYRLAEPCKQKIKKSDAKLTLSLVANPDILAETAAKFRGPVFVGFAAETNDVLANAEKKLHKKGLDMICANDVSDDAIGFNSTLNEVTLLVKSKNKIEHHVLKKDTKQRIAQQILQRLPELIATKTNQG